MLCGLDTLGDLNMPKNKKDFLATEYIEAIPSKETFARVLNCVSGKEIGDTALNVLRMWFGRAGKVFAVDGKAICSTAKAGITHSAL